MIKKYKGILILSTILTVFMLVLASCGTDNNNSNNDNAEESDSDNQINNDEESSDNNEANNEDTNNNENKENSDKESVNDDVQNNATGDEPEDYSSDSNPVLTLTMESGDEITVELYPDVAPNTVANFISLVENGFYDGLIFHRVIPGFMIQGGDPDGNGTGGPGYGIAGEFDDNDFENDLIHEKGVISMARAQDPDSAGSQFFLMAEDSPHLDGEYAGFGKITSGIEVVDDIVSVETTDEKPKEDQQIETMTVDTKGTDYDEPEIIE